MALFPQLATQSLWHLFRDFDAPDAPADVAEDEAALWFDEVAIQIAKSGRHGLDYLLARLPTAAERRLRSILIALPFLNARLVHGKDTRPRLHEAILPLLSHADAWVASEAVDTLRWLAFREEAGRVRRLLKAPSAPVVSSALRFLAWSDPKEARPILEKALKSPEPLIRQNAVDELEELQSVASLPVLRPLLDDPDADVRQAAQFAVDALEGLRRPTSAKSMTR